MIFWRKNKNVGRQEQENRDDKLLHPVGEPEIEPSTDDDTGDSDEPEKIIESAGEQEQLDEMEEIPTPKYSTLFEEKDDEWQNGENISEDGAENQGGWLSRLAFGLSKSSSKIALGVSDVVSKKRIGKDEADTLEEMLLCSDVGPAVTDKIIKSFSEKKFDKDVKQEEILNFLAEEISSILKKSHRPMIIEKNKGKPFVIMICGVNGVGKTTTIGKLASIFKSKSFKNNIKGDNNGETCKVMIAAADTFRAAAIEQLDIWANKTHSTLYKKDIGADAASVAYEAYQEAVKGDYDILIIDTAGRLQNKKNLMEELKKIVNVVKKLDSEAPQEVILVLDATVGQNALSQVETYKEMIDISGLVLTKLDGTARGGVLVGLSEKFGIPVYAVGIGEKLEDLQPFNPDEYAKALVGVDTESE